MLCLNQSPCALGGRDLRSLKITNIENGDRDKGESNGSWDYMGRMGCKKKEDNVGDQLEQRGLLHSCSS